MHISSHTHRHTHAPHSQYYQMDDTFSHSIWVRSSCTICDRYNSKVHIRFGRKTRLVLWIQNHTMGKMAKRILKTSAIPGYSKLTRYKNVNIQLTFMRITMATAHLIFYKFHKSNKNIANFQHLNASPTRNIMQQKSYQNRNIAL